MLATSPGPPWMTDTRGPHSSYAPGMIDDVLARTYWIGGSPCAGKSSVAAALADRFGMKSYTCDDAFEVHKQIVDPGRFPTLHRVSRLSWNDLWMRPVNQQVRDEIQLYVEEFPLILDDLRQLPRDRPILAEGSALMPALLEEIGVPHDRAIWIVLAPAFQRQHYTRRDWIAGILAACEDPDQAWRNWMARDIRFAVHIAAEATALGRPVITVDGSQPLATVTARVAASLGLDE